MQSSAMFQDRESYQANMDSGFVTQRLVRAPRREDAIAARINEIWDACGSLQGVAIESGLMTVERVTAWLDGRRDPDSTAKLSTWLDAIDSDIAERAGDFVMTPTARRFLSAFEHARAPRDGKGRRGLAMIFGSSGAGKTCTAEYAARMDSDICYVLVDGEAKTWVGALGEVARVCGRDGASRNGETLKSLVLRLLSPGGLLIFDHAHLMQPRIMEQLLTFPEEHQIGLAFIGNLSLHAKLAREKLTQLTSRASGATVIVGMPDEEEVDAHLINLAISGRKEREFCQTLGQQDGGLRYLYETVRKARQIAAGMGNQPVNESMLKAAAKKIGCWGTA